MEEIFIPVGRFFNKFLKSIETIDNIVLLKQKEVIQWIFGDTSFLPTSKKIITKTAEITRLKKLEDEWGRRITKLKRPDLDLEGQWTGPFGEEICKELYILLGQNPRSIKEVKDSLDIDFETDNYMIEVKTQTYYTTGTAGEKVLGVPFKYRNVLNVYEKPLKILCIGGIEKLCKNQYGIFKGDDNANIILEFYKNKLGIEYIAITDILKPLLFSK